MLGARAAFRFRERGVVARKHCARGAPSGGLPSAGPRPCWPGCGVGISAGAPAGRSTGRNSSQNCAARTAAAASGNGSEEGFAASGGVGSAARLEPVRAVLQGRPRFRSIHPLAAGCPAGPSRRASPGRCKAVASTAFPPKANQKAVFRKRVGAGEAGKPSSAAFRHRRPARFQFRKRQSARRAFSASVRRVPPIKKGIVRIPYNPFFVCWFRRKPRPRTCPCGAGCLHAGAARRVRTRCSGAGLRPTRGCRRRCRERAGPWRGAAKTPWRRCG